MLGKSDAWLTSHSSQQPSETAYHIADFRIFILICLTLSALFLFPNASSNANHDTSCQIPSFVFDNKFRAQIFIFFKPCLQFRDRIAKYISALIFFISLSVLFLISEPRVPSAPLKWWLCSRPPMAAFDSKTICGIGPLEGL